MSLQIVASDGEKSDSVPLHITILQSSSEHQFTEDIYRASVLEEETILEPRAFVRVS